MAWIKDIVGTLLGFKGSAERQPMSSSMENQVNQNVAMPQVNMYNTYIQPTVPQYPMPSAFDTTVPENVFLPPWANQGSSSGPYAISAPPTVIELPSENPKTPGEWVKSTPEDCDKLKDKATIGGYDICGSDLWVIKTTYQGESLPGKLKCNYKKGQRHAFFPRTDSNTEGRANVFEVFCAPKNRISWVECSDGAVPPNAVVSGKTLSGEKLYVGRTYEGKSLCPGMIQPSLGALRVSFGGNVYEHKSYEVMCID